MHPLAHMLTGALIGQVAPNPSIALAGGFVSHLILDAIPHTEGETFRTQSGSGLGVDVIEAGLEFIAGVAIVGWVMANCPAARDASMALGTLAAVIPDLIDQPLGKIRGTTLLHVPSLHWTVAHRYAVWGILTQVLVATVAAVFLWRVSGCG